MAKIFREMLNLFGAYIAFMPLLYFTISLFSASIYKSVIAFGIVFVVAHFLQQKIYTKRVKAGGKAVLITGCDTGFGNMAAHRLASHGMVVFAGCLNMKAAEEGFKRDFTPVKPGGKIIPVQLDVTRDDQVQSAREFVENIVKEEKLRLWAVVNNAGLGLACEAELVSMTSATRMMDVNYFGVVRVSNAFLPLLRLAKGSRIVSMSSILAFNGLPTTGVYTASKAAVLKWSESLRVELLKFDVQVICICPDFYKTPMTSPDIMVRGFDAELARLSPELRDTYGDEYLENQREMVRNKDKVTMTSPDTSPVIDAIYDSVLCYRPKPVNLPIAWPAWFIKALLSAWFVPQIVIDWVLMTLTEQDKVPVAWSKSHPDTEEEEGEGYQ